MTDLLASSLRRHRVLQAERRLAAGPLWTSDPRWADLVFTSEVGTPIDPSHARRDFKKLCVTAGVPCLSLYEMRHTVASLMVDADIPLREVADLLGHKDLEMVVKRYRHRTEGVVKSHVACSERWLRRNRQPTTATGVRRPACETTRGCSTCPTPLRCASSAIG